MFFENCVLKNLRPATLLNERLQHRSFPVNFAKLLKMRFFTGYLQETASVFAKKEDLMKVICVYFKSEGGRKVIGERTWAVTIKR